MKQFTSLSLLLLAPCHVSALPLIRRTDSNNTTRVATPALAVNFPDPAIVQSGNSWYAFATSGNGKNIQAAVSEDFQHHDWSLLNSVDVLPDPGPWALNDGNIWAPAVTQLSPSKWVMYYAANSKDKAGTHCIGAATSSNVLGPYNPIKEPLACPLAQGGAIDPAAFKDPKTGNLYVVYKVDGNSLNTGTGPCKACSNPDDNHPTPIMVQQVSTADGYTPQGAPFEILDRSASDGPLVEAPSLFYQPASGMYYLTFSSGCYSTNTYDISFAYSTDLHSTFTKSTKPIMTTQNSLVKAPGGASMTPDGKFSVFHATVRTDASGEPIRYMYAAQSQQTGTDMTAWII